MGDETLPSFLTKVERIINGIPYNQSTLVNVSCVGESDIQSLDTHPFSTLAFSEASLEAVNSGLYVWAHVFYSWKPEF